MKRQTLFTCILAAVLTSQAQQKFETKAIIAEPKVAPVVQGKVKATSGVSYNYPVGLRNLGMLHKDDNPCCNFLSFNTKVNNDAYMWAPLGQIVTYYDASTWPASDYHWIIPGSDEKELETQDADATYNTPGVYSFPTVNVTGMDGQVQSYTAAGKVKVGGVGEIAVSNMLHLGKNVDDPQTTAVLASLPFNNGSGFLGGTNNLGLTQYGNLFMIAHPTAEVTAVRVYLPGVPSKYSSDAKLQMQIFYPMDFGDGKMVLNGLPLEAVSISMSDVHPTTDTKLKNAAVAEFKLDQPLKVGDKPFFFVTVSGFGTDPQTEDFAMLIDIKPVQMDEAAMGNLLAHNSFCYFENQKDFWPINYFGGPMGASFMICPEIDTKSGTGIQAVETLTPCQAHYANGQLTLTSEKADEVYVYNVAGQIVCHESLTSATSVISVNLQKGVYMARFMQQGRMTGAARFLNNN